MVPLGWVWRWDIERMAGKQTGSANKGMGDVRDDSSKYGSSASSDIEKSGIANCFPKRLLLIKSHLGCNHKLVWLWRYIAHSNETLNFPSHIIFHPANLMQKINRGCTVSQSVPYFSVQCFKPDILMLTVSTLDITIRDNCHLYRSSLIKVHQSHLGPLQGACYREQCICS